MSEEEVTPQTVLELREEVLQRVEAVEGRVRRLSLVTIVVAVALVLGFVSQITLPYVGGSATQTVNLADPALVGVEVFLTALALAWLYVGVSDYRFVSRLAKSIKAARAKEEELEKAVLGGAAAGRANR